MRSSSTYGPPWAVAGRKILVVGLGRSGIAAARLCAREGGQVTVTDSRGPGELDLSPLAELGIERQLGGHRSKDFTSAELVVVSPGVPIDIPELCAAREAGVPVIGEVELAAAFLTDVPIVAFTGTNGKSTTTALAGAMLSADGRRPFTGGNLGSPLSESVLSGERPGSIALELSSFQLDTCIELRPQVAVILNLEPDHLDRHGSFESYAKAKARIFRRQREEDAAVIGDDATLEALTSGIAPRVHRFVAGDAPPLGAGFGLDAAGGGATVSVKLEGPGAGEGDIERYSVGSPALRGPHNAANAAAASLACRIAGVSPAAVQQALDSFPGLPHRLERVRVREGVEWINDSKATNVGSALVALRSFERGIVWIAGGRGKGTGYRQVMDAAEGRVKALLTIGEDGERIAAEADGRLDLVERAGTLEEAVARAARIAGAGDVVLLSPACASFDQFSDFEERGRLFKKLVEELP